jgi:hypothetical protein
MSSTTTGRRTLTIRVGVILTAALSILLAFLLTGCSTNGAAGGLIPETLGRAVSTQSGAALADANTVTITGVLLIEGGTANYVTTASGCAGTNGYNDLSEGATATATSGNGDILGQGYLDGGTVGTNGCALAYTISGLPAGKDVYMVEVSHRGMLQATKVSDTKYMVLGDIGGN